jgi:hypothetical protein
MSTQSEGKISQDTPPNSCELASIDASQDVVSTPAEVLAEFQLVHDAVYNKVDELADDYKALMLRFDSELLPLVDRAQSYLSQRGSMYVPGIGLPSWSEWCESFLKRLNIKMSPSTLGRRLKEFRGELGDGQEETEAHEGDAGGDDRPGPLITESPKVLLTKGLKGLRKLMTKGDEQGSLLAVDNMQLAIDEGLVDSEPNRESLLRVLTVLAPLVMRHRCTINFLLGTFFEVTGNQKIDTANEYLRKASDKLAAEFDSGNTPKGQWYSFKSLGVKAFFDRDDTKCLRLVTLDEDGQPDASTSQDRCICNRLPTDDALALTHIIQILKDTAVELCRSPHYLKGFAEDIDTIAERIGDRIDLDKRMDKLAKRLTKRPAGWRPNQDMLSLQLRRDRRFLQDMKNIKAAGGTTYRGQKIWGRGDELFIFRYTRETVTWEIDERESPSADPDNDERFGHVGGDGLREVNPV